MSEKKRQEINIGFEGNEIERNLIYRRCAAFVERLRKQHPAANISHHCDAEIKIKEPTND